MAMQYRRKPRWLYIFYSDKPNGLRPPRTSAPPISPATGTRQDRFGLGRRSGKGFAHIGVLKILEANQIPIHLIVGSSAGSMVGSLYAFGYSAYRLQTLAISVDKGEIIDWTLPDNGFIKGERLAEFVNRAVNHTPWNR
jgi:NTE family protein